MLVKALFFSTLTYILLSWPRLKRPRVNLQIQKAAEKLFGKARAGGLVKNIDTAVKASNIKKYIPFMDVPFFILLTLLVFAAAFIVGFRITRSIITTLAVSCLIAYLPMVFLDVMAILNGKKVRTQYLSFLNAFYGFYGLNEDIVDAFRRSADYTGEPLSSFIKRAVYKYDHSNTEFSVCMDELDQEVRDKEFNKFIKFTKLHLIYGGDYKKALEKLIEQARRLESARASLSSSAAVGVMVVMAMAGLDIIGFLGAYMSNPDIAAYLKGTTMGQILALGNVASVALGLYIALGFYRR